MEVLPVHLTHTQQVEKLPDFHQDPFDRLLIAQATSENLTIITSDLQFRQYDIEIAEGCREALRDTPVSPRTTKI